MKKRNNRSLQCKISTLLFMLFCILGVIALSVGKPVIAAIEFVISAAMLAVVVVSEIKINKEMSQFISLISEESANITSEVITRFPFPLLILNIDGEIVWYNDFAASMFDTQNLYGMLLPQLITDLKWTEILKKTDAINMQVSYNERQYKLYGSIIKRSDADSKNVSYSVLLYFNDITDSVVAKKKREDEKTDVAIITIDNYDDVFQPMDDVKSQETTVKINTVVSKWVNESNGIMKKTDSDRYLIFFEHRYLENYIKNKFDILEKVRAIGEEIKEPITISIGIGTGGHLIENESDAKAAVKMVWGRGGDQAAIKDSGEFKFFGSATRDYEKSTRVKTRIFAFALKEMIAQSDNVIIMGHNAADYDSYGAAVGISRAAKNAGKNVYIVIDNSPAIKPLFDKMQNISEYSSMIISPNTAEEIANKNSLLLILDTHRPSMLPAPNLIKSVNRIVLIDHHRRSTEFIDNLSLMYLEPYASSTCELVTEILQYIDDKKKMTSFEATALYLGIFMDTKNFVAKTGVRTFEAASYLKRYGINTMEIKALVSLDFDDYVKRMDIIREAEIWHSDIAVSVCENSFDNMRVISSQAADEMLNISGIKAGFVIYQVDNTVCFSARSLPDINVQIIMEKLGGGGHASVAGCQIKNITLHEARELLKNAIKEYIDEN